MSSLIISSSSIEAGRFGEHLKGAPACRAYAAESEGLQLGRERIPARDAAYGLSLDFYRTFCAWWNYADREPLYVSGPAGAGKTTSVLYCASVLGVPVVSVTVRPRMEKRELIGRWVLGPDGAMHWVDGPAALAWRYGWMLLINEFSAVGPEMWISANDILEGAPLELDQTGEVVPKHPAARIVITDNARGHASESEAGYYGRSVQDRSVIDRCWHTRLEGLNETEEAKVLVNRTPPDLIERFAARGLADLPQLIAGRLAYAGADSRTRANEDNLGFSNRTFALSHRALERLMTLGLRWVAGDIEADDPVRWAAATAIGHSLDRVPRDALITQLATTIGSDWADARARFLAAEGKSPKPKARARRTA